MFSDLEVELYIQNLGYRLASSSGQPASGFSFFVVDDPSINAFAMPGGYIGIHSGLILASRSESELAGVMAHEIAHVTQRHLARSFEKASQMNLPMTAAVIAAILLGASNPQMGQAALAASMAGSTQMTLDFTRSNEQEADRVGIQMLAGAGFDPHGMPGFFERLQQEYRFASSGLEFLRTHPVTLDRIADSRNRAEQYARQSKTDSLNYQLVQAKLRVLQSKDPKGLAQQLKTSLSEGRHGSAVAERYAYALTQLQLREFDTARDELKALLKADPQRIAYLLALARLENESGNADAAQRLYRNGLKYYPNNALLTLAYGEHLLQRNSTREAAELLREHTRSKTAAPLAYELLAEAETRNGRKGVAHIALADYYLALGESATAIEQLNLARQSRDLDFYYQSLVEAKLTELQDKGHKTRPR